MFITAILISVSYVSMGIVGNWDPFAEKLPEDSAAEISGSGRIEKIQENRKPGVIKKLAVFCSLQKKRAEKKLRETGALY